MKKTIFINGRFLTQRVTGVQRVADEIVKELDKQISQHELNNDIDFIILTPKVEIRKLTLKSIKVKSVGYFKGHLWEQFNLPFYTKAGMLINFCNTGPVLKKNQIVFIHDAAVFSKPGGYSKKFVFVYRNIIKALSLMSKKVITVSEFSKKELESYIPLLIGKIEPIYLGIDHMLRGKLDNSILNKHQIVPGDYILAVSSLHPNKNFQIVEDALNKLDNINCQFVIAGGTQSKIFSNSSIALEGNIKFVGYVSDEELKALYKHAKAFIFPSIYEGFGLPPIEAMSFGCPVLASTAASIPEICGDAPLYFDPYNSNSLVKQINRLYNESNLTNELKEKSIKQSEKYRWRKTVKKVIEILK
ncbi:glycosyltransferase family 4 protein [Bacillus sp. ISL-75]|uniref:glycosyltransferase family 4 protein n=1 Tax=Bacillus sp. ISL-75 TaxID=2819137 RepID=UPI001BEBD490|nr:glycosyltransferase family 1 protein [Bacillus sp. ISL-75]MBT2730137.1 glycosyltransferase family 4 protein [Bacillus sp. ISL-75]